MLIDRYAKSRLDHNEWVNLKRMVECRADKHCAYSNELIIAVFAAALSNETGSPHMRAQMMTDLGIFYANELGDYEPALTLLDDALAIRPHEFDFRAARVDLLLLLGRLDAAADGISDLRRGSHWDDYLTTPMARIETLEVRLVQARGRRSTSAAP
jgi:hypothetical protein